MVNALRSPVILTGPHNGWMVPDEFTLNGKPLGLEKYWFDPQSLNRRHEACDWGIQPLFNAIARKNNSIALLGGTISRLVVDLNRTENYLIYNSSSEDQFGIPGNSNLSAAQIYKRRAQYYDPYHKALDELLVSTREKFGTAIWIDMHSFSPLWLGAPRLVGIGTLKIAQTAHTEKIENQLHKNFGEAFVPDEPYSMLLPENQIISGSLAAAKRNNIEYFGLEIRNDLLQTPNQIENMGDKLLDLIPHL